LSHCQNGQFTNLTAASGLVSDVVRAIAEDSDGRLWVTTGNGLSRLQGKTIRNFTQTNGLPDNSLHGVWQDVPGRLWIGSNLGLVFYRTGPFYAYDQNFGLSDRLVNVIRSDSQGNVWAGTGNGLKLTGNLGISATHSGSFAIFAFCFRFSLRFLLFLIFASFSVCA